VSEANKEIVRRFFEEGGNKRNLAVFDEIVVEDFKDHAPMPHPPGRQGLKQMLGGFQAALPDMRITVEDLVAEGDRVVARLTVGGTHKGPLMGVPATGKRLSWTAIHLFRIQGGRIVERWAEADVAGMLRQLGLVPEAATPSRR